MLSKMEHAKKFEPGIRAYDMMIELKNQNFPEKEVVTKISSKFSIAVETAHSWYNGQTKPNGRKGTVSFSPELFYVLGALLGDGCTYLWNTTYYYTLLAGDEAFAKKYATAATICLGKETKAYENRSQNIWFVRPNNFELYALLKRTKENSKYLEELVRQSGKQSEMKFVEGFFDAEGCVKIIKEECRKTPKICLDITNTDFELLEVVRKTIVDCLNIEARYSSQPAYLTKDGHPRKKSYHLRIYKKESVRKFLENIHTTKLKAEKMPYVERWLNNGL